MQRPPRRSNIEKLQQRRGRAISNATSEDIAKSTTTKSRPTTPSTAYFRNIVEESKNNVHELLNNRSQSVMERLAIEAEINQWISQRSNEAKELNPALAHSESLSDISIENFEDLVVRLEDMKDQVTQLARDSSSWVNNCFTSMKSQIEKMEQQVAAGDTGASTIREDLNKTKVELIRLMSENETMQRKIEFGNQELQEKNDILLRTLKREEITVNKLRDKVEELKLMLKQKDDERDALAKSLLRANRRMNKPYKVGNVAYKNETEYLKSHNHDLERKIEAFNKLMNQATNAEREGKLTEEFSAMVSEVDKKNRQITNLQDELRVCQAKIAQLETELNDVEKERELFEIGIDLIAQSRQLNSSANKALHQSVNHLRSSAAALKIERSKSHLFLGRSNTPSPTTDGIQRDLMNQLQRTNSKFNLMLERNKQAKAESQLRKNQSPSKKRSPAKGGEFNESGDSSPAEVRGSRGFDMTNSTDSLGTNGGDGWDSPVAKNVQPGFEDDDDDDTVSNSSDDNKPLHEVLHERKRKKEERRHRKREAAQRERKLRSSTSSPAPATAPAAEPEDPLRISKRQAIDNYHEIQHLKKTIQNLNERLAHYEKLEREREREKKRELFLQAHSNTPQFQHLKGDNSSDDSDEEALRSTDSVNVRKAAVDVKMRLLLPKTELKDAETEADRCAVFLSFQKQCLERLIEQQAELAKDSLNGNATPDVTLNGNSELQSALQWLKSVPSVMQAVIDNYLKPPPKRRTKKKKKIESKNAGDDVANYSIDETNSSLVIKRRKSRKSTAVDESNQSLSIEASEQTNESELSCVEHNNDNDDNSTDNSKQQERHRKKHRRRKQLQQQQDPNSENELTLSASYNYDANQSISNNNNYEAEDDMRSSTYYNSSITTLTTEMNESIETTDSNNSLVKKKKKKSRSTSTTKKKKKRSLAENESNSTGNQIDEEADERTQHSEVSTYEQVTDIENEAIDASQTDNGHSYDDDSEQQPQSVSEDVNQSLASVTSSTAKLKKKKKRSTKRKSRKGDDTEAEQQQDEQDQDQQQMGHDTEDDRVGLESETTDAMDESMDVNQQSAAEGENDGTKPKRRKSKKKVKKEKGKRRKSKAKDSTAITDSLDERTANENAEQDANNATESANDSDDEELQKAVEQIVNQEAKLRKSMVMNNFKRMNWRTQMNEAKDQITQDKSLPPQIANHIKEMWERKMERYNSERDSLITARKKNLAELYKLTRRNMQSSDNERRSPMSPVNPSSFHFPGASEALSRGSTATTSATTGTGSAPPKRRTVISVLIDQLAQNAGGSSTTSGLGTERTNPPSAVNTRPKVFDFEQAFSVAPSNPSRNPSPSRRSPSPLGTNQIQMVSSNVTIQPNNNSSQQHQQPKIKERPRSLSVTAKPVSVAETDSSSNYPKIETSNNRTSAKDASVHNAEDNGGGQPTSNYAVLAKIFANLNLDTNNISPTRPSYSAGFFNPPNRGTLSAAKHFNSHSVRRNHNTNFLSSPLTGTSAGIATPSPPKRKSPVPTTAMKLPPQQSPLQQTFNQTSEANNTFGVKVFGGGGGSSTFGTFPPIARPLQRRAPTP